MRPAEPSVAQGSMRFARSDRILGDCRDGRAGLQNVPTLVPPTGSPPSRPSWPSRLTSAVVWGSNTGVGKTLVSAGLARVARQAERPLLYIKPAQTGFPADSDARLVGSVADVAGEG